MQYSMEREYYLVTCPKEERTGILYAGFFTFPDLSCKMREVIFEVTK
jgi:hypothetical protein